MANPNDPALDAQKNALDVTINSLKAQLANDPENADLKQQLSDAEAQMKQLQGQRKDARDQYRRDNPPGKSGERGGGQGRANAPGQRKKNP